MNLYRVTEGEVTNGTDEDVAAWTAATERPDNWVLCVCKTAKEALKLASYYDAGKIDVDNAVFDGLTITALSQSQLLMVPE